MSNIATTAQYQEVFNIASMTSEERATIEIYLGYATALIQKYCDRIFGLATYSEWVKQPYSSDKQYIYTTQYPINKVYLVGTAEVCAKVKDNNVSSIMGSFAYDSNVFSKFTTKNDGSDDIVEILASDKKIISALKAELENDSNVSCEVEVGFESYPTAYVKPFGAQNITGDYEAVLEVVKNSGLTATVDIVDENCLLLNEVVDKVFVKYSAGYSASDMPKELVFVCCQVANDLISFATSGSLDENSGISSNMIKSEQISDYSYTKFDDATRDQIITKYTELLDRWTKKTFIS